MSDDNNALQAYLESLPDKLTEELAEVIRDQAELLSAAQKQALQSLEKTEPTGALEASCVVVPGATDLEVLVQAGGELTTREIRAGSGVEYDYALGFEFGTSHQPARPFFWSTYQAHKDDIRQAIDEAANEVLSK
jgi:HK97 gp10 family phage protein